MNNATNKARFDRILVVDDTTANLQLLTNLLTDHGYTVHPASDGELALEFVRSTLPDLILLDIRMPGMDGYEVCRRLKANEKTHSIPIIFISILEDELDKVKGFQEGAVDYITKPFRPEEVLARVKTHLRLRDLTLRLEQKVSERTVELNLANRELREEIAERKRAEEALKDREEFLTAVVENIPDMIFVKETDQLRFVRFNKAGEDLLGYSKTELLGKNDYDFFPRDEADFFTAKDREVLEKGALEDISEEPIHTRNRGERILHTKKIPIRDKFGKPKYLLGISEDITERKRAEESLHRLNRELRAISICNQVLIRAKNEQTLLTDICRIIYHEAGYPLVWVGYVEHDLEKSIRPVAWAGLNTDYVAKARLSWSEDLDRGRGPAGIAVRSGEPIPVQDIALDPRMAPWRDGALTHGYRSAIALPLKDEKAAVFGVLLIYSPEPHVFTTGEIELLQELAGDLAFGITVLRTRAERAQVEKALFQSNRRISFMNRIANVFLTVPDDQMFGVVLEVLLEAMHSPLGIFGFIDDNGDLVIPSFTPAVWNQCKISDKSIVFPSQTWGESVWGRAIREKKVFHTDGPFHTPQGHILIRTFLTSPVVFGNETIGLLSFANSEGGYHDEDKDFLKNISERIAPILHARLQRDREEKDRRRAEAQVERLKNNLSNIIDSMPTVLVGMDQENTVTQWNRQVERITGIPATAAIGHTVSSLLPDFTPWITAMRREVEERRPAIVEKLLIAKEGERRFFDLMLYPLITNGVGGSVLRIEDVTEQARIQELMIQTEKMISLGGLAAGMAHEINNPLGIITQAAQNIERRISPDLPANRQAAEEMGLDLKMIQSYFEKRRITQFMESIREAAFRASRIISNMLQFSRQRDSTIQPGLLSMIVDRALELAGSDYDLKKKYDFKRIEIVRDYEEVPEIPMVSVEMEQVLLNLLKNAAQAMSTNPPERKPLITLRLRREDRYILLEVEDNGPGMTEDIRRRVFEPFFTTKDPGIGTGLGLSVSYMIITQNHKGLMEVESTPGRGTCFKVRLPLAKEGLFDDRAQSPIR